MTSAITISEGEGEGEEREMVDECEKLKSCNECLKKNKKKIDNYKGVEENRRLWVRERGHIGVIYYMLYNLSSFEFFIHNQ